MPLRTGCGDNSVSMLVSMSHQAAFLGENRLYVWPTDGGLDRGSRRSPPFRRFWFPRRVFKETPIESTIVDAEEICSFVPNPWQTSSLQSHGSSSMSVGGSLHGLFLSLFLEISKT